MFQVGSEDSPLELFQPSAASLTPAGGLVIANSGMRQLLSFDSVGAPTHVLGGHGQGPGEFDELGSVFALEDGSVLAFDPALSRMTRFGAAGEVEATHRLETSGESRRLSPLAVSSEGDVFAILERTRFFNQSGAVRDSTPLLHYRRGSERPDTVAILGGRLIQVEETSGGWRSVDFVFGPDLVTTGRFRWFAFADSHDTVVHVYTADGRLESRIRWEEAPRRVEDEEYREWQEAERTSLPEMLPQDFVDWLTNAPRHGTHPRIRALAVEPDGSVWLGLTSMLQGSSLTWLRVTRDGSISAFDLPSDARILDAAGTRLAVLRRNELEVESVWVYSLITPR